MKARLSAEQQRLVTENIGIAHAVLKRLRVGGRGLEDARAEAMLALCEAASTYEPNRGAFSTWAWAKVSWRLLDFMSADNAHPVSIGVDAVAGLPDGQDGAERMLGDEQERRIVLRVLHDLRFSCDAVGRYLGVDEETVLRHRNWRALCIIR